MLSETRCSKIKAPSFFAIWEDSAVNRRGPLSLGCCGALTMG